MLVKRFADASPLRGEEPPRRARPRLFGLEAGGPEKFVVDMSHFPPGGGASPDASPTENVYVVLAGELTLIVDGKASVGRSSTWRVEPS